MGKLDFKMLAISKDGEVVTSINGRRYTYYMDHAVAMVAWNLCHRRPGKALAILKKKARRCIKNA